MNISELARIADSARVQDSNKRLLEYLEGALRKNGLETMVSITEHEDGYRLSPINDTSLYLDTYLDGEDLVVEGSISTSDITVETIAARYAKFAGIPVDQAEKETKKMFRWFKALSKKSHKPVDDVKDLKVSDAEHSEDASSTWVQDRENTYRKDFDGPQIESMFVKKDSKAGEEKWYVMVGSQDGGLPKSVSLKIKESRYSSKEEAMRRADAIAKHVNQLMADLQEGKVKDAKKAQDIADKNKKAKGCSLKKGKVEDALWHEDLNQYEDKERKSANLDEAETEWKESTPEERKERWGVSDEDSKKEYAELAPNSKKSVKEKVEEENQRFWKGIENIRGNVNDSEAWEEQGLNRNDFLYEIDDAKAYSAEYLIRFPPKWVAEEDKWAKAVMKATHQGDKEVEAVVPLVIYKRMGGKSTKEVSKEESKEQVKDSVKPQSWWDKQSYYDKVFWLKSSGVNEADIKTIVKLKYSKLDDKYKTVVDDVVAAKSGEVEGARPWNKVKDASDGSLLEAIKEIRNNKDLDAQDKAKAIASRINTYLYNGGNKDGKVSNNTIDFADKKLRIDVTPDKVMVNDKEYELYNIATWAKEINKALGKVKDASYNKEFEEIREVLSDTQIVDEIYNYLNDIELDEFVQHLTKNYDIKSE